MPNERISRIPPGSRDLLADDVRRRREVQSTWFELAHSRGYDEIIPPTFEYEEVFALAAGRDLASRLIRFLDRDGKIVALRADFTSSIARVAATRLRTEPLPLRLSYAGKVYRQATDDGGHHREAFQLGAELIGDGSAEADVEILRLAIDTLTALGINDFQINIGESRFIEPLLRDFPEEEAERVREAIDRKDRATLEGISGSARFQTPMFVSLLDLIGRAEVLDRAMVLAESDEAWAAIARLQEINSLLAPEERARLVYDLGEIRGQDYYTGIRFEIFIAGAGRSVGAGGRYDGLLGLYGRSAPAVGFMLETDAIADHFLRQEP
ncbi:MAG: ATP phosphoribosyltransferase regulatory subunit [Gemmatimonadota bacterium]|jgi:ATP phosphoribosyltransferase regulatory subunit|nr:ATP phosphoribosyltransferase regulatory subunit [Gemmatimonadota bacterium]